MSTSEPASNVGWNEPPAPPRSESEPKAVRRERIEYLAAFRYVFTHPEWIKNLLIFAAFTLVPVLNTVLVYGYLYETTEHLHRRMSGPYPLFEVRRFAHYMTRGIWCYLIVQILSVVIAPFFVISFDGTMFSTIAISRANQAAAAVMLAVVVPLVVTLLFLFLLSLSIVVTPFLLRAGLTQDFGLTFNFRWVADYLRKMWLEVLLVNVFASLSGIVLAVLGCALFCYGALVAGALMTLASAHLNWQLYELYLSRGGEPIPLKTAVQSSGFNVQS